MDDIVSVIRFPAYLETIIDRLKERNWLIHNFNACNEDLYNPANYVYNQDIHKFEYSFVLDTNIFQYIINAAKKATNNDHHRDAISLVVFCQLASIEIDPTYACYEKAHHSDIGAIEAAMDLALFHKINNSNPDNLAAYSLGHATTFSINSEISTDTSSIVKKLTKYKKLRTWDSFYLIILKIIHIKFFTKSTSEEKISIFIDWCLSEFCFSLVGLVFAIILFGKNPTKQMMKFRQESSREERHSCVVNMTWDLYTSDRFFDKWISKNELEQHIFVSGDKAFGTVLRFAIEVQKSGGNFESFSNHISWSTIDYLNHLDKHKMAIENRAYNSDRWSPEYRKFLIENLEKILYA
ncbi:MAG: hypothetical protein Q8M57_01385 [Nitrosomonas sp.]|uniref:hypothetical protein n=1 Tax=Nitrosomonas sp. TaxID=42353 RepID=UPI00271FCE27|nr:hypothetical protein [Nitrosomonas sp.]MDO8895603.1 hypothetical protein [Nitrosomonas sp.]MDP1786122.1 hypothetical protein [Nitrosomonas sp.]MDP2225318.1 hypothetical protein [Nitrosomonas sp.]MDP3279707.1 hypothetical protein [Nitrosomonas sp.]